MSWRTISFDNSTDGGAGLRHMDRLQECCALLSGPGIAPADLHKWSDVLDTRLHGKPANSPQQSTGGAA